MNRKFYWLICLFTFFFFRVNFVFAQDISFPFECGFEDLIEVSEWQLNVGAEGPMCQDQWMIGSLDFNGGYNSLYISCDEGRTTNYGAKPNYVIAYRTVKVPKGVTAGGKASVDIAFDWKCMGSAGKTSLNFYYQAANRLPLTKLLSNSKSGTLPRDFSKPSCSLYSSRDWQTWSSADAGGSKFTMLEDTEYLLVFIWQNSNMDTTLKEPLAACIDNFQIAVSNCFAPQNIVTTSINDTIVVEWGGSGLEYELQYRMAGRKWVSAARMPAAQNQKNKYVLAGLTEGVYDIRIRSVCGNSDIDYSIWSSVKATCFIPGNMCINYVELDREGVFCESGQWLASSTPQSPLGPTGLGQSGYAPISFGERSILSRHQVNWTQGVYDPLTGNNLRTIPDGYIASVRLGNWGVSQQGEAITFEYEVDTAKAKILLLKYAVVLENPGHGEVEDPYFKLEILDEEEQVIGGKCGDFDFTPTNENIEWNYYNANSQIQYVWKDWSDMGVNISEFHGQKILIRLETRDCLLGAHAGYAYFVLDCADAVIHSTSCGDADMIDLVAPEGFTYIWTKRSEPDKVLSTDRIFYVSSNDTATYDCKVEYIDVEGCGFDLSTSIVPRFPYADFEYEWEPENCENKVIFKSKSCVRTKVAGEFVAIKGEEIETAYWTIDGRDWYQLGDTVEYIASKEGEIVDVLLQVSLAGGTCVDDTTMQIEIPAIHEHFDTLYENLCFGQFRKFDKKLLATSGTYTEVLQNVWGCDSVTVLELNVLPRIEDTFIEDTICSDEFYVFGGERITETGKYEKLFKSSNGCDSVVLLDIFVRETLVLDFDTLVIVCGGDASAVVPYEVISGDLSYCEVHLQFNGNVIYSQKADVESQSNALVFSLDSNVKADNYNLNLYFGEDLCGESEVNIPFKVLYPQDLIVQRWEDVLAVKNEDYNGGYQFSAFQWYKNGQPINGATSSLLYEPNGLDLSSSYSVLLTRASDGVSLMTCVVELYDYSIVEDDRVVVFNTDSDVAVESSSRARMKVWSSHGVLVDELMIEDGYNLVSKYKFNGIYFFEFIFEDGTRDIRKVIF